MIESHYDADHIVIGLDIKGYSLRSLQGQMAPKKSWNGAYTVPSPTLLSMRQQ